MSPGSLHIRALGSGGLRFPGIAVLLLLPAAQMPAPVPIVDSGPETVRILDGGDETARALTAPNSDTYIYHPAPGPKTISLVTDVTRLDVLVNPGETRDLAIRYRGRTYRQRLAPVDPRLRYSGAATSGGVDTVPFRIAPNNTIRLVGTVNGSRPLDLVFDTAAAVTVLSEAGIAKGAGIRPGATNRIGLPGVSIEGLPAIATNYAGSLEADGVVAVASFAGKVVEIDYGHRVIRISSKPPGPLRGYRTMLMRWREGRMVVPVTLHLPGGSRDVLALFDTGSPSSLTLAGHDPLASTGGRNLDLLGRRSMIRSDGSKVPTTVLRLPFATIGGIRLPDVQADLEQPSRSSRLRFNILGNDVLKRFNLVLDYRRGEIHLRPNALAESPYAPVSDSRWAVTQAMLALLTLGVAITVLSRARARRRHALGGAAEADPGGVAHRRRGS